jgi:YggT family protein
MGENIVEFLITFVSTLGEIFIWLIFARVILSWIPSKPNRISIFINNATNPVFNLARKITPRLGMIDLSPIIAYIGIELVTTVFLKAIQAIAPYIINMLP